MQAAYPAGRREAYHELGFFEGNLEMWCALKKSGLAARSAEKGEHGFWEAVNCSG